MRLRIAGHGDAEPRELGLDQGDQFVGVPQPAGRRPEIGFARWRVTAQGDDVIDSRLLGLSQVGAQLIDRRTDTGQVRSDRQLELALDLRDDLQRLRSRRSPGAVGARDEAGLARHQFLDVPKQGRFALPGLRRIQFERQAELAGSVGGSE